MPLRDDVRMVSIDDHMVEPPRVWQDRLPARYRDVGPRVVEVEQDFELPIGALTRPVAKGCELWVYEDLRVPNIGISSSADAVDTAPLRFEQMRRGSWDPVARLDDMDMDGVWAQTPFPSFPGFAGNKFVFAKDKKLAALCVAAYNDFLLDEWCPTAPDRYNAVVILPLWDQEACIREIHRCATKGARAITFPDSPAALGLPSFYTGEWDPVLSAAEETGMPLLMHFGSSRVVPYLSPGAPQAARTTLMGMTLFNAMVELAFSPTLHRHPRLKIAYAEGGIGWVPYALQRMDQVWETYQDMTFDLEVNRTVRPSELIREHVWSCFINDPVGLTLRETIGLNRIVWESDYPHGDGLWPHTRANAKNVFADIPDHDVKKIVADNALQLFAPT